jgi:hypothetical protein
VRHPGVGTVRYPAATRVSSKGSLVKVLSRVASPAGFGLVLLLFFLLPFVSVSCDVPEYRQASADYTGSHLVSGARPEIPAELRELAANPDAPAELTDPPDADVQVLAIVLALLAAAGVLTVLIPQVKARLLAGTALATGTLAVTVITMFVSQAHLQSALIELVRRTGVAEQEDDLRRFESAASDMTHAEVGFWLMALLLAVLILTTGFVGLFGDRLRAVRAHEASGSDDSGGGLGGLSFGKTDSSDRR